MGAFVAMKGEEKLIWDAGGGRLPNGSSPAAASAVPGRFRSRFIVTLLFFVSFTYLLYTLKLLSSSHPSPCADRPDPFPRRISNSTAPERKSDEEPTGLQHVVFGIAASARLWDQRKEYIKTWWRPAAMRGVVWMDSPVKHRRRDPIPPVRISGDTSVFPYTHKQGHRSAIRISRIVSETLRLGLPGVRWFVMGDDDTVFVADNLVRVLAKYDHRQLYYIGSLSESHLQNIYFSYGMAYGGGGFAISYPLAVALSRMQDRCIHRYPGLYGSDDRMQACMAELGVPLTKEPGFHQVSNPI